MSKSISAYEPLERVMRYDRDMDLLHPRRHKMLQVVQEVLPFNATQGLRILDVGVGTGFFARALLANFPQATLLGIDGSDTMISLAEHRLSEFRGHYELRCKTFEKLGESLEAAPQFDVIVSAYALHHLDAGAKYELLGLLVKTLKPGGWLLNADLVVAASPDIETRIQVLRIEGILQRNQGRDRRFANARQVRRFLDLLEREEGDQPITIAEDLAILRQSGLGNASLFWQEYRETVYGGCLPG